MPACIPAQHLLLPSLFLPSCPPPASNSRFTPYMPPSHHPTHKLHLFINLEDLARHRVRSKLTKDKEEKKAADIALVQKDCHLEIIPSANGTDGGGGAVRWMVKSKHVNDTVAAQPQLNGDEAVLLAVTVNLPPEFQAFLSSCERSAELEREDNQADKAVLLAAMALQQMDIIIANPELDDMSVPEQRRLKGSLYTPKRRPVLLV
ncbi:hypothetical protein BDQ12DRAFT_670168 [Crucibulum laeve]|uniref:Uncharacterized protein n=1 Tax=Crucibulum laeve TaxID=68775 RepID=A0A5C3LLX0_9AGAR|nr:hypothetical protein BDQ12DRAFT_670168 [Crucibulum laeve]